jgi:hypothetical protein
MSSADDKSKNKMEEDGHEEIDGRMRVRVEHPDKASLKAKPDADDTSAADQPQRPAADQQPVAQEDSTPHSTQPLANKLKDQLEQAGLKTTGCFTVYLLLSLVRS